MATCSASSFKGEPRFCTECSTLLPPPANTNLLHCPRCGHIHKVVAIENKLVSSVTIPYNDADEQKIVPTALSTEEEGPKVDRNCTQCGNKQMTYHTLQTRSADEGMTVFYTCLACGIMSMRERFDSKLAELKVKLAANAITFTKEEYDELVMKIQSIQTDGPKCSNDYKKRMKYAVKDLEITGGGHIWKLVRVKDGKEYCHTGDLYDIIHTVHLELQHSARDKMVRFLNLKYANVTRFAVETYLELCQDCQTNKKPTRKHLVVKPIISNDLNSRAQVDLIDMQSEPDRDFMFIMVYQDHLTKFVVLKALKNKCAKEVGRNLVEIFTLFGAPHILQSDNGREFANKLIERIAAEWEGCKIVHGAPRHSQSQGSVERANQQVRDKVVAWMRQNGSAAWGDGLKFVQWAINVSYHSGIGRTPYKAVFSCEAKCGLKSSSLPSEAVASLETEEQFEAALKEFHDEAEDLEPPQSFLDQESAAPAAASSLCVWCQKPAGKHKCVKCANIVHAIEPCGVTDIDDFTTCAHCNRETVAISQRSTAKRCLENQAEVMKQLSDKRFKAAAVGDTVTVPIPDVDRGRADPRNVLAVVTSVENGFYQLATNDGKLNRSFVRSQFDVCAEKFIDMHNVLEKEISVREAAGKASVGSGQGFVKCDCKLNCATKRCSCKKAGVICNSRCHNSSTCCNK